MGDRDTIREKMGQVGMNIRKHMRMRAIEAITASGGVVTEERIAELTRFEFYVNGELVEGDCSEGEVKDGRD
jgi:hypothetical protein